MLSVTPTSRLRRIDVDLLAATVARYLNRRGFSEVRTWAQRCANGQEKIGYLVPDAQSNPSGPGAR